MSKTVKFNTGAAGEHGYYAPGQVATVPDQFASDLIAGHYAVAVVDPAPDAGQVAPDGAQGDDPGAQATQTDADADQAAQGDPEAEYRASLWEKIVRILRELVKEAGIDVGRRANKPAMVDALVEHWKASNPAEVESAEAAAGENAAARTDAPQPRRRRQPSGKGPGGSP